MHRVLLVIVFHVDRQHRSISHRFEINPTVPVSSKSWSSSCP